MQDIEKVNRKEKELSELRRTHFFRKLTDYEHVKLDELSMLGKCRSKDCINVNSNQCTLCVDYSYYSKQFKI